MFLHVSTPWPLQCPIQKWPPLVKSLLARVSLASVVVTWCAFQGSSLSNKSSSSYFIVSAIIPFLFIKRCFIWMVWCVLFYVPKWEILNMADSHQKPNRSVKGKFKETDILLKQFVNSNNEFILFASFWSVKHTIVICVSYVQ